MNVLKAIKNIYRNYLAEWCLPKAKSNHRRVRIMKRMGVKIYGPIAVRKGLEIRGAGQLVISKGVSLGPGVLLDARKGLEIGESAVIAYQAIIWSLNHDYNDIHFVTKGAKTIIGKYAWVCSRSIILPGITVGEYAVVASGAIVTKDVPPYAIVAGVPAKIIKFRFDETIIRKLNESRYWEESVDKAKSILSSIG